MEKIDGISVFCEYTRKQCHVSRPPPPPLLTSYAVKRIRSTKPVNYYQVLGCDKINYSNLIFIPNIAETAVSYSWYENILNSFFNIKISQENIHEVSTKLVE